MDVTIAVTPEKIAGAVRLAFADEGAVWRQWQAGVERLSRPDASREIAVDYDGALSELQAVQDFAVRRLQANDPRGRPASELAPLSLPVLPHP